MPIDSDVMRRLLPGKERTAVAEPPDSFGPRLSPTVKATLIVVMALAQAAWIVALVYLIAHLVAAL